MKKIQELMRSGSKSVPKTIRRDATYICGSPNHFLARKDKNKEVEVRLGKITEVEEITKVIE